MGIWSASLVILVATQAPNGSIAGTVTDGETGAPLAGATVALADLDRSTVTDDLGQYLLRAVPAGPQHVTVRRIGYTLRTFHALVPREGTLAIDVALHAAPVTLETIEVHGRVPAPGLDAPTDGDPAFPDQSLALAAVRHHPLLAEPDVFEALGGSEIFYRPESPGGLYARGGASDQIAYLLDGIPVFSPYHAGGTFSAWNPDALSRVDVLTTLPSPAFPDALSGVVAGHTRTPGRQFLAQGSVSTTQARTTFEGPIGAGGSTYLVSVRSAFPGLLFHRSEASYLQGAAHDGLAKIQMPMFGGSLRLLGYSSDNDVAANAGIEPPVTGGLSVDPTANEFGWESLSLGGEWSRKIGAAKLQLRAWHATAEAEVTWRAPDESVERLATDRGDDGALVALAFNDTKSRTSTGLRLRRSGTRYELRPESGTGRFATLGRSTPAAAAFVQHQRSLGSRAEVNVSMAGIAAAGGVVLNPGAGVSWRPLPALSVSASYSRRHQFEQSLRNPESIVGTIFPADLYVGAGDGGVPVARSDQGALAAEYRPTAGLRLGARVYTRSFNGLALVAPRSADPFATSSFELGTGTSRGASVEAAMNGARYALIASYGFQQVRLRYGSTTYVPGYGPNHSVEAGIVVFPFAATSVRLGMTNEFGRRTTAVDGRFEWEACNLIDQGCEFAGTPRTRLDALGATSLPAYSRIDLGVRQHWHLRVGGRDCLVAVFATVTNLLGRRNVLTMAVDPETGETGPVEMRPRSPLVVGVDWRF